jgi:hypothetical protein
LPLKLCVTPPGLSRLDECGADALPDDPRQQGLGYELRPLSLRRNAGAPRALTRRDST